MTWNEMDNFDLIMLEKKEFAWFGFCMVLLI
jgi:hypothetical protein